MADFALWATAAEEALGFGHGEFLAAYERNRKESSLHAIECSPAVSEVINLVRERKLWEGTFSELLAKVNLLTAENRRDPRWPKSGRAMAAVVARAEPNFSVARIKFMRLQREGGTGARRIRLETVTSSLMLAEPATSQVRDDVTILQGELFTQSAEKPRDSESEPFTGITEPNSKQATQSDLFIHSAA
jgi:hypothetical protein